MTNVTQEVRDFLNKNPFIVKSIDYNILNVRALAFYIIKQLKLSASPHAVMSAIRRYKKESSSGKKKMQVIEEIFRDSKKSTKSRLLMIKVKRHLHILRNIIPAILDNIHVSKGEVIRIVEGRESMKFIIDHSKKEEILSLIPKDELLEITPNLGEINIHLSERYGDMPGVISPIINELAINEVNIIELIGGMPELTIVIKEEDISKCHDAILRFFYSKK